jgi:hypothetical protein
MNGELEPVSDQEYILRRVHANHFQADLPTPIQRAAFCPSKSDQTGLSCYRERFVETYLQVLTAVPPDRRGKYYVCRLCVSDLMRLGLTVVPDPSPQDIPGHCIIPELSKPKYDANHDRLAEVQFELAILGSRDIVLRPSA